MDNDLLHDPVQDLTVSETVLSESFESLKRALDTYGAIRHLVEAGADLSSESFEASARATMMAVCAGTDHDVEDLDISMESVKAWLAGAIKAILAAIANFFTAILSFFSNLDITTSVLITRANNIERRAAASRGKEPREPTLTLGRNYKYLRVGAVIVHDPIRLEAELKKILHYTKTIQTSHMPNIIAAAGKVAGACNGKSGEDLTASVVKLVQGIDFDGVAQKLQMTAAPYDRFHRNNVSTTGPMLGGKSLFYLKSDLAVKGVRGFRFHGFLFDNTGPTAPRVESEYVVETLGPADIGNLPKHVKEILNVISKASNASVRNDIKKAKAQLDNYIKSLDIDSADVAVVRKLVSSITYWMREPMSPLYSNALSVCRVVLNYCAASVNTYR